MRILLVNNTFGNFGGGSEKVTLETGKILEEHGQQVYYFASDRKPYYVENYKYQKFFPKNSKKIFYNREAKLKLDAFIKKVEPDIIHVHCFQHNLTSSVIDSCRESGIPTVMTFHDCNFACPAGTMLKKDAFCSTKDCIKGYALSCIKNYCFSRSVLKSIVAAGEFSFRRSMGFYEIPEYIICPSKFILNLAVEAGIKEQKLVLINNFINTTGNISDSKGEYFLYSGRVVNEKGLYFLVRAFKELPWIKLRIAGKGAYEEKLKKFIKQNKIQNIELVGLKKNEELENEYKNCIATILPSICAEAFGLSILESFLFGKPVIASRIGGIPEVVSNNKDGLIVEPGNIEELKKAVLKLWNDKEFAARLGKNAKIKVDNFYTPELYYKKLINVYQRAVNPGVDYIYCNVFT